MSTQFDKALCKGFDEAMDNGALDDLERLYVLFSRVDAVEILSKKFLSYIKVSHVKLIVAIRCVMRQTTACRAQDRKFYEDEYKGSSIIYFSCHDLCAKLTISCANALRRTNYSKQHARTALIM